MKPLPRAGRGYSGSVPRSIEKRVHVERGTYAFSSTMGDKIVAPLLEKATTPEVAANEAEMEATLRSIGVALHNQEKHIPFNHKLEQLRIELQVCTVKSGMFSGGGLSCTDPEDLLVVHDEAIFAKAAGMHTMLDQIGDTDICTVGQCSPYLEDSASNATPIFLSNGQTLWGSFSAGSTPTARVGASFSIFREDI